MTVFGGDEQKFRDSHIRTVNEGNLGILLSNTDYLISKEKLENQRSLFGDDVSQVLPLREMFQGSGSEISIVGLGRDNFVSQKHWDRLGYIYEVLRSKRIQNIIPIDLNQEKEFFPLN